MKFVLGAVLLFPGVLLTLWGHLLVDIFQTMIVSQDRYADSRAGYSVIRFFGVAFLVLAVALMVGLV